MPLIILEKHYEFVMMAASELCDKKSALRHSTNARRLWAKVDWLNTGDSVVSDDDMLGCG